MHRAKNPQVPIKRGDSQPTTAHARVVKNDVETSAELNVESWAIVAACPKGLSIQQLNTHLANLCCLLAASRDSTSDRIVPHVYWPPISRELHALREVRAAIEPDLARCKPWGTVVLEHLSRAVDHCFRFYYLESGQNAGDWCERPLHDECHQKFERLFQTLAHLPNIEVWRPIDYQRCQTSPELVDELIARTVTKVFEEYYDDDEFHLWGTIETLLLECELRLERRRDEGHFQTWSPLDIRRIRVLADRLGCTEPALEFEEMDRSAAFRRLMCDSLPPWPIHVDNEVRQWLQRIISWCSANRSGASTAAAASRSGVAESPKSRNSRTKWTVESATQAALRFIAEDPGFLNEDLRHWATKIGCSTGLISKLRLWQELQKRKKGNRDADSVRALATAPRFLAEAVADETMRELIHDQLDEAEEDRRLSSEYQRPQRSWRS